jgi:Ca-activated chloride channel family protein
MFVGRTAGALPANAAIRISGRSAGRDWTRELSLAGHEDRPGVAPVWARRKLAALEDSRLEGTPPEQVRADSLNVALAYQLISRYTSLVAVDPMPARPQNVPLDRSELPTNLPAGWSYEAVFGSQHAAAPSASKHAYAAGAALQRMAAPAPAMVDQSMAMNTVTLPQTATPAELKMIFGLLSMLAAIALLVWQYRRGGRRT